MDDFSIASELNGFVTVVAVAGRVDSFIATSLDSELDKLLFENKLLVLDLKGLTYLSSAGVRAIMRALQSAQRSGGDLKLAAVPAHVGEVLQTVGMLDRLQIYPSVEQAVASF